MNTLSPIDPKSLPEEVPPVPRGFTVATDWNGRVFAIAPADKRKRQARVQAEPPRWELRTDAGQTQFEWVPLKDFPTRPIREFMIAQGLEMESKFGISMTRKAPKASSIVRQEYGMTGKTADLLEQFVKFRKIVLHKERR